MTEATVIVIALIVACVFLAPTLMAFIETRDWNKGHEERTKKILEFANEHEKYREENYYEIVANGKTYSFHKDELDFLVLEYGVLVRIELKNETIYIDDIESIKYPKGEKPKINFEQDASN